MLITYHSLVSGLVNAKNFLNSKVVEKQNVQFANEGLSKLVKGINLTIDFRTPLDKDEPWPKLQRNLHGFEVYLNIEMAKESNASTVIVKWQISCL